ncbi:MAG: ribosome biogenesis GTPase Der [Clostridia bacterium]|nr:ribosome biogenesis GTPase Der [Clostridia bacterium]
MTKPLVAIVGRPNVGKSTFFNKVVGKRISIVEDKPGVTRDRLYADAEWCGHAFTLVDTGGIEIKSNDKMWQHIKKQAEIAVDLADVIVFFVDGKQGLIPEDYDVADYLRMSRKPIVLAVNKIDNNEQELIYDFYSLGIGDPIGISAEQSKGIGDILDEIISKFKNKVEPTENDEVLNIAVVGKPNAGKSSLVNKILGYERVIVSDVAGTTRDAIDTTFSWNGRKFNIIDTAGMRRKSNIDDEVEQYSVIRSLYAIRRADVVLVVIDSSETVSEQDVRICGYVHEQGKPSLVLMNKWDTVEKDTYTVNKFKKDLDEKLKFMDYYVPLFISAKTGQRLDRVMGGILEVYEEASKRVSTGTLNDVIQDAVSVTEPPTKNGKRLKILFATEASTNPPTFIFFVNDAELMHFSYKRYLENTLRKAFEFKGSPIRLIVRNKDAKDMGFND